MTKKLAVLALVVVGVAILFGAYQRDLKYQEAKAKAQSFQDIFSLTPPKNDQERDRLQPIVADTIRWLEVAKNHRAKLAKILANDKSFQERATAANNRYGRAVELANHYGYQPDKFGKLEVFETEESNAALEKRM